MIHRYKQLYILHKIKRNLTSTQSKDVEGSFDTSNYELRRLLPKGNMKKPLD